MPRPVIPDPIALEAQLVSLVSERLLETTVEFDAESNLYDAGLDSMAIMQLLLLIEEHFGVLLPDADLSKENFSDIRHLAALIRLRMAQL